MKPNAFFKQNENTCTLAFEVHEVALSWNRSGCVVAFIWEDVLAKFLLLTFNCSPLFLLGVSLTGSGEKSISGDWYNYVGWLGCNDWWLTGNNVGVFSPWSFPYIPRSLSFYINLGCQLLVLSRPINWCSSQTHHSMGCTIVTDKLMFSRSQCHLCFITVSSRTSAIVTCSRYTHFFIDKIKSCVPVLVTNTSFNLSFRICLKAGKFWLSFKAFVLFRVLHKFERQSRNY